MPASVSHFWKVAILYKGHHWNQLARKELHCNCRIGSPAENCARITSGDKQSHAGNLPATLLPGNQDATNSNIPFFTLHVSLLKDWWRKSIVFARTCSWLGRNISMVLFNHLCVSWGNVNTLISSWNQLHRSTSMSGNQNAEWILICGAPSQFLPWVALMWKSCFCRSIWVNVIVSDPQFSWKWVTLSDSENRIVMAVAVSHLNPFSAQK